MRTLTYQLRDLKKAVICIGFEDENNRTQIRIDCGEVFSEYPNAAVTMKVQAPKGGIYPATVTRDGNMILWTVRDCDVANKGNGEFQLTFTDGTTVIKICPGRFHVDRSLKGSGTAPSGVQDWLERAEEALEGVEAAEIHQPMIGLDGYWYTWDQENEEYVKTNTKAQGSGADLIDDTTPASDKVFSSEKVNTELNTVKSDLTSIENELVTGQAQTYTGVICTLEGQTAGDAINIAPDSSVNKIYHTKKNLFKLFNRTAGTLTGWGASSVRPFKDNEYYNGFIINGTYDGSPAGSLEYITDGIQTKWGSAGDAGGGGGKGTLFPVMLPAGKYTLSGLVRGQFCIMLYDADAIYTGRWNNSNYGTWGTETNVSVTFEVTGGTRWIGIMFCNLKDTSTKNPSTFKNIMLVEGETSATYEAYEGEVITESTSALTAYAEINKIWTDAGSFDIDTTVHRLTVIEDDIDALKGKAVVLDNDVIHRNLDQLPEVHACVSYGVHSGGVANNKRTIGILVTTDVHGRQQVMQNAIDYLNEYPFLDMGMCLGDITGSYFNDSDGTWYTDIVNGSEKPFYTALGNHDLGNGTDSTNDKCVTVAAAFDKWIKPTRDTMGMASLSVPYYAVHNTTYGISMIFLNSYDVPDTKVGDDFVVSRAVNGYSQAQIDWLISELANVPSDNHLILFQHCNVCDATKDEGAWTQKWNNLPNTGSFGDLIPDIINAWINGSTLEQTYSSSVTGMDSITVDADFSERGEGVFVAHVFGHYHRDIMAHSTKYSGQKLVSLMCTADGLWQNGENDLPRVENTKTQDAITILSVNKTRRTINLVRVGSTKTISMTERNMIAIPY